MPTEHPRISYEGEVYVRPIGRGIVLEDEPGEPHLDDWIETWLAQTGSNSFMSGFSTRVRIVVERVDGHDDRVHGDDDIKPARARPTD